MCLYYRVDGIWDPERWVKSFGGGGGSNAGSRGGSRGPSPLTMENPRERRGDLFRRNSGKEMCVLTSMIS